jgi:hypothetical protein
MGSLPAASNRADWSEVFEIYDDETGEAIDLSDAMISLQLRDDCRIIDASILIVDLGKFEASFAKSQLYNLCAATYEVGCTLTRDGVITQEFIGALPVMDGVVR